MSLFFDIHSATAAKIFGADLDEVLPEMRRDAKMVNYGISALAHPPHGIPTKVDIGQCQNWLEAH